MIERSTNEARQGSRNGVAFSVLRISLLLAAMAMIAIFVATSLSTENQADPSSSAEGSPDPSI
jgi:flagellar basal body-associated protein FliL